MKPEHTPGRTRTPPTLNYAGPLHERRRRSLNTMGKKVLRRFISCRHGTLCNGLGYDMVRAEAVKG